MTNGEAVQALLAEFPEGARSKIRRTYAKAKKAGATVSEAYEQVRKAGQDGAFGAFRISKFDPTGHEATLRANHEISDIFQRGIYRAQFGD